MKIGDCINDFLHEFKNSEARVGSAIPNVEVIPTGLPSFDTLVQDCGGVPRGRAGEGHGFESSGKSTWGHHISAAGSAQNDDFKTLWLDIEGCFVPKWAAQMGQNLDNTVLPEGLLWAEDYIKAIKWGIYRGFDLIVVDSLPAMVPRAVGERHLDVDQRSKKVKEDQSKADFNERALTMKEALARATIFSQVLMPDLTSGFTWKGGTFRLSHSNTFIYFINQMRAGIDTRRVNVDSTTPGGNAIRHLYSVRWQFKKIGMSKETNKFGNPLYQLIRIKNVKNKVGTPFGEAELMLNADGGFYELNDSLIHIGLLKGIIEGGGSGHYKIDGQSIHGKANVVTYLNEQPDLLNELGVFVGVTTPSISYDGTGSKETVSETVSKLLKKRKKSNA